MPGEGKEKVRRDCVCLFGVCLFGVCLFGVCLFDLQEKERMLALGGAYFLLLCSLSGATGLSSFMLCGPL